MFAKGLRAQRAGRVAPRRGGAKRRAAALGAAQRRKAPPQAAERRAAHKACFSAFNFAPIIEKQKMLTGRSAGIRPVLWPGQPLGIKLHGQRLKYLRYTITCLWYSVLAYSRCGPSLCHCISTESTSAVNHSMCAKCTVTHGRNLLFMPCLLYTSPSPRDRTRSRMPSSA